MRPTLTAFKASPDNGQGHARDMRVRWALEEVDQPYDVRLLTMEELKEPVHRARHPFGKIPTYEEGELTLFESGAIVLHIAETHDGLLPSDPDGRERAVMWLFAALNTIEPPIVEREAFLMLEAQESWFEARLPRLDNAIRERLADLSASLGASDWLDGDFSAADLMMVSVLRRLEASNIAEATDLLGEYRNLAEYVARGEARPAYQRAFASQRAVARAAA